MGTFNFKDKNGNQGIVEGVNDTDYATLNDLIEAVNIIGQSSSARNFINSLARKNELFVLTGEICLWTSSTIPDGFLLCNGSAVSRTTYANLFEKIGTTYGTGDGSTTFNLPDLRDRYIIGANTNVLGTYIAEQLPNIAGDFNLGADPTNGIRVNAANGCHSVSGYYNLYNLANSGSGARGYQNVITDASLSNAIYTNSGHVHPLSLALNFIIKT